MPERDIAVITLSEEIPSGTILNMATEELPYTFVPLRLTIQAYAIAGFIGSPDLFLIPFFARSPDSVRGGSFIPDGARYFFDESSTHMGNPIQGITIRLDYPITVGAPSFQVARYHGFCVQVANGLTAALRVVCVLEVMIIESE